MLLNQWPWEAHSLFNSECFKYILIHLGNNYMRCRGRGKSRNRETTNLGHLFMPQETHKCQMFTLGWAICSPNGWRGAVLWYTLSYVFCLIIHGKISDINVSVAYLHLFKLILDVSQILSLWMLGLFRQACYRSHPSYIIY